MNSNHKAQDFDAFPGASNDLSSSRNFQEWDENPNFNIFDYIGEDEHDNSNTLANQEDPKDKLWKNYQYNQVAFGGPATYDELENSFNNMRNPMLNYSNQQGNTSYDNGYYQDCPTSSTSAYPSSSTSNYPVKTEVSCFEDEMSYPDSNGMEDYAPAGHSPTTFVDPSVIEQRVNQATKKPPRKYRIKPDTEKVNPVYKQKREKNNDAVRRSREKAKALQAEKDNRLSILQGNYDNLLKIVEHYRKNCRCGIKHPKLPEVFDREY